MRRWIAPAVLVAAIVLLTAAALAPQVRRASVARQMRGLLAVAAGAANQPAAYGLGRAAAGVDAGRLRQVATAAEAAGDWRAAGVALGAAGDYPAAQAMLERALANAPDDPFAALALGNVLDAQGQRDAALARWPSDTRRALGIQLHRAGSAAANAGDRVRARLLLEQAMAIDPANPNPAYTLGGFYWASDRAQSVALYRAALAAGGLDPFFQHVAEGRVALAGDALEDAATAFEAALQLRPDHAETLSLLATTLDRLGRPDEALAYYRRAAEASPDPFRSLLDMGQILLEQGAYDEAVRVLGEAVKLRVDRPNGFALLAQAYAGNNQPGPAVLAWQQAIALNPDNAFYHAQLGDALLATGDEAAAVEAYRQALQRNPDSDYARRQLQALDAAP